MLLIAQIIYVVSQSCAKKIYTLSFNFLIFTYSVPAFILTTLKLGVVNSTHHSPYNMYVSKYIIGKCYDQLTAFRRKRETSCAYIQIS